MKIFNGLAAFAASAVLMCTGQSASAAVTYTFSGQGEKTFTYSSADFITAYTFVPISGLTASSGNFDSVEFCFAGQQCGNHSGGFIFTAETDTIYTISSVTFPTPPLPPGVTLPPGVVLPEFQTVSIGEPFEFASGTFGEVGRSASDPRFGRATLTVDDGSLAAAVPEPSSWAMMIAGFGLVGAASRRRRGRTAVTLG